MPPRITNASVIRTRPGETELQVLPKEERERLSRRGVETSINLVDVLVTAKIERVARWRARMEASDVVLIRNQEIEGVYNVREIRFPADVNQKNMNPRGEIELIQLHPFYGRTVDNVRKADVDRALSTPLRRAGVALSYVREGDKFLPSYKSSPVISTKIIARIGEGEPLPPDVYDEIWVVTIKERR